MNFERSVAGVRGSQSRRTSKHIVGANSVADYIHATQAATTNVIIEFVKLSTLGGPLRQFHSSVHFTHRTCLFSFRTVFFPRPESICCTSPVTHLQLNRVRELEKRLLSECSTSSQPIQRILCEKLINKQCDAGCTAHILR